MLENLTELLLPGLLLTAGGAGLRRKRDVYGDLLAGAQDGLRLLATLAPSLVLMLTAVTMLRESGFFDWLTPLAAPDSACIRCAARTPSGVAALPSPSRFAARLPHRLEKPSSSAAHAGNSRRSPGRSTRHSRTVSPVCSMARASADQRQMGPASDSVSSIPAAAPASAA